MSIQKFFLIFRGKLSVIFQFPGKNLQHVIGIRICYKCSVSYTHLVCQIKEIPGIKKVTLTTNGTLLKEQMKELAEAGLDAVNISLDTLNLSLIHISYFAAV